MELIIPATLNLLTALICFCLGALVLARNPRKITNMAFAFLASTLMLWAIGVYVVIRSRTLHEALLGLHFSEFVVCLAPAAFYHFVGYFPKGKFDGSRHFLLFLYISALVLGAVTFHPSYIQEVTLYPDKPPLVVHSPALIAPIINILIAFIAVHTNLRRKLHETQGFGRRQTQFVMTGIYSIAALSIVIGILEPVFNVMRFQAYGPVTTTLLMGCFAYAMVKYHLLDTRAFVSRLLVFLGSTVFVIATFLGFMALTQMYIGGQAQVIHIVPALLTGLVVSFVFQTVKDRVAHFIEVTLLRQRYDVENLYSRLAGHAAEVVQLDQFLKTIAADIQETIGVRTVRVLLLDPEDETMLATEFTSDPDDPVIRTRQQSVLLDFLRERPQPLILEQILHRRPDERMVRVASALADLDAFFCLPLITGDGLVGIMTLGQKDTHDIYSEQELIAFKALAGPLGTAIANARLYQELEKVHMHQSKVFGRMREGVIAVDTSGKITTTNEASIELLGSIKEGQYLEDLPPEIAGLLRTTLDREVAVSDYQTTINGKDDDPATVIVSSSCLKTPDNVTTGAVALIYDLTHVKRLERNVQRADRLSSLGTLAAGMAHEIKNPLVSIKTFTQLLADRYKDPDFRSTFEEVVPHEVDRIDTIVSRLLDFARPRPVNYQDLILRRVIEQVLALVENQMRKGFIKTELDFPDGELCVTGDEQQLHQVFLNLVLNAVDAMQEKREGTIAIRARTGHIFGRRYGVPRPIHRKCARISVTDTGCGIPADQIAELFTPFYTTKSDGCGLGLAVVHSILTEHGGEIDVSSVLGEGTTFTLSIPLASIVPTEEVKAT